MRGSQTIDESLSELAEQMTIEENSSKDNGNMCVPILSCIYEKQSTFTNLNLEV